MAKILLCDDSKFTRQRVRDMLQNLGAEIIEAGNGVEALEKIESEKPDLVLLDLLMPELDGLGVLSALKDKGSDLAVIVLSADIQNTTVSRCIELGAKAFLNKPPQREHLQSVVKEYLNIGGN